MTGPRNKETPGAGSRTGENRPSIDQIAEMAEEGLVMREWEVIAVGKAFREERAARVRAEEALRRLREFIKNDCEAARIIDAALSTTPAGCKCANDPNGLLAAVPEKDKPAGTA